MDGKTSCLFLTFAEVTIGDHQATVEDRLNLIYSGTHHNWFDKYLILLDPPAADVHALLVIGPGHHGEPEPAFVYLDSDLLEIGSQPIVDWGAPDP